MSYSALHGPMPGDSDYRAPAPVPYKPPSTGGGAKPSSGSSWTGADTASTISSGANLVGTFANLAAGGPQKAERDSRRTLEGSRNALEIARLQANGAGGAVAAQVEATRIAAEAAGKSSSNTVKMAMIGVGALAILGIVAAVVLRK